MTRASDKVIEPLSLANRSVILKVWYIHLIKKTWAPRAANYKASTWALRTPPFPRASKPLIARMAKKNPLRRLSVVWRLKEAFEPTPTSPAPDIPTISKFLSISKTNFLRDVKEDPVKSAKEWTVVMGNEAGGMLHDSSSLNFY